MDRIPVSIEWVEGEGGGSAEIVMGLGDFESTGASIRSRLKKFKKKYEDAIAEAKKADASGGGRAVQTRQRWRACRMLADFNGEAAGEFEITNYKEAYARDFGLPVRSIRTYLDFGARFAEDEVLDEIPYSVYAELIFRMNGLRAAGLFESEKKNLIEAGRAGSAPNRDAYRARLKGLLSGEKPG